MRGVNTEKNKAIECAHYTQAFALWYLQRFMKNSKGFMNLLGYDIGYIEDVLGQLYGKKNLTIDYLNYFREKFDLEKADVDPRDWPLIYFYDLCDMLYSNEQELFEIIGEWNDDVIARSEYSLLAVEYFAECKNSTLSLLDMAVTKA